MQNNEKDFAARGGWWVVAQFALIVVGVIATLVFAGPLPDGGTLTVLRVLAVLAAIAGVVLGGLGAARLNKNLTAFPRPIASSFLVKSGAYGLVRHPIYTGVILLMAALGLWAASEVGAVATAVLFTFFDVKAEREEQWLSERFADYRGYRDRVKKLIPWLY
ncbi:MAG: isoprenylcysteine carboxylmethyltransferase family protein [Thermoflexales bacterium]|nr:isoprenylcysteine carboxylmethyltransferase family protein [Thermoflexales bacterium]